MTSQVAPPRSQRRALGTVAITTTVLAWSGFALGIRGIAHSRLTPGDVAMIRFLVPLLVLAPWIPRAVRAVRGQRVTALVAVMCGAGLPYFLIASAGGKLTTAALVGLVIPGSVPVFVTVLQVALLRQRPALRRVVPLGLIVLGLLVIVGIRPAGGAGPGGITVLLLAGLVWAVYTTGIRHTTLGPVELVVVLCVPSFALTVLLAVAGVLPSSLLTGSAPLREVLVFTGVQGVGVGLVAALGFTTAIRTLGADVAAATGALAPVVTAVLGVPVFGEVPTAPVVVGLVVIVAGVVLANRPARQPGRPVDPEPALDPVPSAPVPSR